MWGKYLFKYVFLELFSYINALTIKPIFAKKKNQRNTALYADATFFIVGVIDCPFIDIEHARESRFSASNSAYLRL